MIIIETQESNTLLISLDIIIVSDCCDINLDDLQKSVNVSENIDSDTDYKKLLNSIIQIIEEFGYTVVNSSKSNQSNSLYFTFCRDDEFNAEEVTLIVGLRVSDHNLPLWNSDKSIHDAENRQLHKLQQFAHDNKFLNNNLLDDEEIPVEYMYVKFENKFYVTLDDVLNKVRQKMQKFIKKHK